MFSHLIVWIFYASACSVSQPHINLLAIFMGTPEATAASCDLYDALKKLYASGEDIFFALECLQCDKYAAWYSEEEHERHIELCQNGLVPPTPCRNHSHTHCIVSWYRSGDSKEKVITERKCGTVEDVTGCTLYNSKIRRKVRHLLSVDRNSGTLPRKAPALFVEVCSESCPGGRCLNSGITRNFATVVIILLVSLLQR